MVRLAFASVERDSPADPVKNVALVVVCGQVEPVPIGDVGNEGGDVKG